MKRNLMGPDCLFDALVEHILEEERAVYNNPFQPFEQHERARKAEFAELSKRYFDRICRACDLLRAQFSEKGGA